MASNILEFQLLMSGMPVVGNLHLSKSLSPETSKRVYCMAAVQPFFTRACFINWFGLRSGTYLRGG
jgi:hypothetical protein